MGMVQLLITTTELEWLVADIIKSFFSFLFDAYKFTPGSVDSLMLLVCRF